MTGPQLRTIREKQFRMTQQQLAEELGYATHRTILLMEKGRQKIPKYIVMAVERLLEKVRAKSVAKLRSNRR